ncbi:MAG TPA: DUF4129 domain-containing protein [Longimicrobiales bacterium]|nr:DUF4129 domain-containing protein [Longimicrobiales bacterium]
MPQGAPTRHGITADEVDAALAEILARPEFAPAEPPLLFRWIGAALGWIGERLSPLLRRLVPDVDFSGPGWEAFGYALLGLGGLLGLALLSYLAYLAARAIRRRRRPAGRAAAAGAGAPATAADWDALARAAAAREDWRAAAMAMYQSVLLRLAGAGALTLDRAKTPGDYRRDIRSGDRELAARFEAFLHRFEQLAYGAGAPHPDHYGRLIDSAALLGSHG